MHEESKRSKKVGENVAKKYIPKTTKKRKSPEWSETDKRKKYLKAKDVLENRRKIKEDKKKENCKVD